MPNLLEFCSQNKTIAISTSRNKLLKMRKLLLVLSFFLGMVGSSMGQATQKMRHFMQQVPSQEGSIPYGNNPKAGKYVQVGDAKLYYEVYGEGDPFVILHGGLLGSTYEMHRFIDSLSINYQVIAISTRGHGKSELGKEKLSIDQKVGDILAVITMETSKPVTILGFSDGGFGGFLFASKHPERVKKLIAMGAGEQTPELRKMEFNAVELFQLDPEFMKQQLSMMPEPERLMEFGNQIAEFYNSISISEEVFKKITCPVLVLAGENDQNAKLNTVIRAYQMLPNAQLGIIPNAGHGVFLENFEAVWFSMVPLLKN
jgi:pimeloyl-ACP methyl ester carboxylesterase